MTDPQDPNPAPEPKPAPADPPAPKTDAEQIADCEAELQAIALRRMQLTAQVDALKTKIFDEGSADATKMTPVEFAEYKRRRYGC